MSKFCLTISYPNTPGGRFDNEYYITKHLPMTRELFGAENLDLRKGIGTPFSTPAPFLYVLRIAIPSVEDFMAKIKSPAGQKLTEDVPRYTDIEPIIEFQVSVPL